MRVPLRVTRSDAVRQIADGVQVGLLAATAFAVAVLPPAASVPRPAPRFASGAATWSDETASDDAHRLLAWVVRTRDHGARPFVVIDKRSARLYVFDERAALMGASRVLLGAAIGDDSAPNVGARPMEQVKPHERTTPAGRFVARSGHNHRGEDVIWVDHAAAVSMHRVRRVDPAERRLERLASPVAADRRISYGCINVPTEFYDRRLRPVFVQGPALVYVLPEVRSLRQVFDLGPEQPTPWRRREGRTPGPI